MYIRYPNSTRKKDDWSPDDELSYKKFLLLGV